MKFGASLTGLGGMALGGLIGSLFPGPGTTIGMMIGGTLGGFVGNALFPIKLDKDHPPPPKPRENRQQVSTFGAPIPVVYGSGRLAGNIIWMDRIETTWIQSKHRQDGVRYYEHTLLYTTSFAVAFCEGPVTGIARIWINNEIFVDFRDPDGPYYPTGSVDLAAGNLETSVAESTVYFSVHLGNGSQDSDSTISEVLGATEAPSYRNVFYIVFKDFPIGEFNGIPRIEVEIAAIDEIAFTESEYTGGAETDEGWIWSLGDTLRYDNIVVGVDTNGSNKAFIRFLNVDIENGSQINYAYLIIQATGSYEPSIKLNIKIELADNPSAIASGADYNSRNWSTDYIEWDITSSENAEKSPDISSLINQVLARVGWASGNAIQITIVPDATVSATDFFSWYGYGYVDGSPTLQTKVAPWF